MSVQVPLLIDFNKEMAFNFFAKNCQTCSMAHALLSVISLLFYILYCTLVVRKTHLSPYILPKIVSPTTILKMEILVFLCLFR